MGDVTALLNSVDDRFVIYGSGEEIRAEFDTGKLPALAAHWKRDYFFYANGYVKDMDWWDASPFTVAQLPFHGMSAYPYPDGEAYPSNASTLDYQLNWNDRFDSGRAGAVVSIQLSAIDHLRHRMDLAPEAKPGNPR
jgi:hypothetical protein